MQPNSNTVVPKVVHLEAGAKSIVKTLLATEVVIALLPVICKVSPSATVSVVDVLSIIVNSEFTKAEFGIFVNVFERPSSVLLDNVSVPVCVITIDWSISNFN